MSIWLISSVSRMRGQRRNMINSRLSKHILRQNLAHPTVCDSLKVCMCVNVSVCVKSASCTEVSRALPLCLLIFPVAKQRVPRPRTIQHSMLLQWGNPLTVVFNTH